MTRTHFRNVGALLFAGSIAIACATGEAAREAGSNADAAAAPLAGGLTQLTPDAGRQVIVVKMITDGTSNRFEPADFEAQQGDVIRYTLESGVHNVRFVADSSSSAQGLSSTPGDYLQLPGQTWDVKVDWQPGSHFYQCDPHAALGMVGRVTVK